MKLLSERLRDALGDGGTSETTPRHIWKHNVTTAAQKELRPGETTETVAIQERLNRAYNNGEPMWMAAYDMVVFAQNDARARRESDDGIAVIRGAAAMGVLR